MHRREDIYRAVPILRAAGICNISFDLIAGLPKQTHASWQISLGEAIDLSPEHISIYMMEIDEGSRLGLEVLQSGSRYSAKDLPSEEAMAEFYELGEAGRRNGPQLEILAAGAVSGLRRGRAFFLWDAALGQSPRCRGLCRSDL